MSAPQHLKPSEILFISEFASFCRSKGGREYVFTDNRNCACAQFLRASGRVREPLVYPDEWFDNDGVSHIIPEPLQAAIYGVPGSFEDWIIGRVGLGPRTFSALALRLESLLVDQPLVERGL